MSRRKDKKKKGVYSENITDSYDESARVITDHEAHRNVVYELPSYPKQIKECFMIQMKRYTKQKVMWIAIILLVAIPVIFLVFYNVELLKPMLPSTDVTNIYIASLLQFMPVIVPLLAAIACGSMISQEFNERTVYLSLPLPMSRSAFYLGKFFAGLVLIEGVVAAAYGITMILAMTVTSVTYTREIFVSMLIMLVYVFFCCALTYMMSTKLKRGSTILPFVILYVVMPIISVVLAQFVSGDWAMNIASYLPSFSPEMALFSLGSTAPFSLYGLILSPFKAVPGKNAAVMMAVTFVFGLILLIIGDMIIKRRDM